MVCDLRMALTLSTLLGVGVSSQQAAAVDAAQAPEQATPPSAGAEADGEPPSLEFLEFLGQWETDEGEWISPEDLANEDFVELIASAIQTGVEPDDTN